MTFFIKQRVRMLLSSSNLSYLNSQSFISHLKAEALALQNKTETNKQKKKNLKAYFVLIGPSMLVITCWSCQAPTPKNRDLRALIQIF